MTQPYERGDQAVKFVLDADKVTVHSTTIQGIAPYRDGWRVYDHIGVPHEVDAEGVAADLVPMDAQLQHELKERGEGFEVVREDRLRGLELIEPSLDQEISEGGRDGI